MSGKRLLDTNILIALFLGDRNVIGEIGKHAIFVPSIGIGELRFGAEKSTKVRSNQIQVDMLINEVSVLPVTADTALHYGIIKSKLYKKGKPIPENDIWIAAIARENDMILVSRDNHFLFIDDIDIEYW